MRLNGREDVSPVVFWDEDTQPLLGAVTLEIFCLGIDPVNGRLIDVDAFVTASAAHHAAVYDFRCSSNHAVERSSSRVR